MKRLLISIEGFTSDLNAQRLRFIQFPAAISRRVFPVGNTLPCSIYHQSMVSTWSVEDMFSTHKRKYQFYLMR